MTTKAIPDGYDSLIPSLIVSDGARAIEFYKNVLGATEVMRMNHPQSEKIAHAELKIREHVLMLGDECPEMGMRAPQLNAANSPPVSIFLYVSDVDAIHQKALSQGARSVMPPTDMFWGDRYGKFIDPFGHQWGVATKVREVSPEECAKAMENWGKKEKVAA